MKPFISIVKHNQHTEEEEEGMVDGMLKKYEHKWKRDMVKITNDKSEK